MIDHDIIYIVGLEILGQRRTIPDHLCWFQRRRPGLYQLLKVNSQPVALDNMREDLVSLQRTENDNQIICVCRSWIGFPRCLTNCRTLIHQLSICWTIWVRHWDSEFIPRRWCYTPLLGCTFYWASPFWTTLVMGLAGL